MKGSVLPSFTELRSCCQTAKSSNPLCGSSSRDNELDLLVFKRKLECSKPGCEFTASQQNHADSLHGVF